VDDPVFPCPCCGYIVFSQQPGSYDICPVCGWEDDLSQLRFPTTSGANAPLLDCQREYEELRAVEGLAADTVERRYVRDPLWRPIDPATDPVELPRDGVDYGLTYADPSVYYYWRRQAL
jgi:hypothetical protein